MAGANVSGHAEKGTVVVIGAGVIGLLSALEIQSRGHDVIVVDGGNPGGDQSASYGNGAWLSPGAIMPISVPGLWRKIPGYLLDPNGPFVIRWRNLLGLAPWLWRFVRAGDSWEKIAVCAKHRFALCHDTVEGHLGFAKAAGVEHLISRTGLMFVYSSKADAAPEKREWDMRRQFGVSFSEIGEAELRELEPGLAPHYSFGMRLNDGAFLRDTRAYLEALAALLASRGGRMVRARVTGFSFRDGRLTAVKTDRDALSCTKAVIAAGAWSASLAKAAGNNVPLVSERGYHIVLPEVQDRPRTALMPFDGKMAVTPTAAGLRIAGQVELASIATPPDWRRTDILYGYAERMFPDAVRGMNDKTAQRWLGHRPSTPDGLPSIGPSSFSNDVVHAFGHGHSGMCQAPATARLVAAHIDGSPAPFAPDAYRPQRF
ncbi:NAD(P)/FAD-dependent oxidoreductase [Neorhizobium alkalisoli]|uniref:D-amino-acid dehydrogenase n=1 Tax=Neorhizobium alkalisoli TaxID=528178 RepID=A0A561R859_9HYPH|nr:FAD-dependent oxidoreductase [Neorhizobium alkalisoli]TWF58795.1 D-amino-acid dehydrogenase [Neorhizobium alkalisoli]